MCEMCKNKATTEWYWVNEEERHEGGSYYTYRCEAHPEEAPYLPRAVKEWL